MTSSTSNIQHIQQQSTAAKPLAQLAAALGSINAGNQLGITLREVMKILRRHVVLQLPLPDAVVSLLAPRVPHGGAAAQQLQQQLQALGGSFKSLMLPQLSDYSLTSLGSSGGVRFAASSSCYVDVPGADVQRIPQHDQLPAALRAGLVQVAFAVAASEPVMLLGPTCFKSKLVSLWAELMGLNEDVVRVHLSPGEQIEGAVAMSTIITSRLTCHKLCSVLEIIEQPTPREWSMHSGYWPQVRPNACACWADFGHG
jgi:hypothetical protein